MRLQRLPAEALFVNEMPIESRIQGYRTLGVSGRELSALNIDEEPSSGGDGSFVLSTNYPPREITVDYLIRAKNDREFRQSFEELNKILGGGEKSFRFNDDKTFHYRGYIRGVGDVPKGVNTFRSSFTLFCPRPFKYGMEQIVRGTEATFHVNSSFKTLPSKVTVIAGAKTPELAIENGTKMIKLTQLSLKEGDKVVFDFKDMTVKRGSESLLYKMSLDSQFENFYVENGVPIKSSQGYEVEVGYREMLL